MRLFGSWARGAARPDSDADAFVLVDELASSERSRKAAEALHALGPREDAMTRRCSALYHASFAPPRTEDLEPARHQGLLSLFGPHVVKTGELPAALAPTLRRIQAHRESSDGGRAFVMPADVCRAELDAAPDFLAQVRAYAASVQP